MKWTTEAKVGAFTIVGIVLFIMGILFVGRVDIFTKPQMTITGDFAQVHGLKNGCYRERFRYRDDAFWCCGKDENR